MKNNQIDWQITLNNIDQKGFSIIENFISKLECNDLINLYDQNLYRKTIVMEEKDYGEGQYKYFDYPLPNRIKEIRESVYPKLVPVANSWMDKLSIKKKFPETLKELQNECHQNNQTKATPLILKYEIGGFNHLHQDLYGEIYFPLQAVIFLNEPETEFTGGEFIIIEEKPNNQSKAIVLKPKKGDMLIFTTNFRPKQKDNVYYKIDMKHGVSEVHSGKRHTLGIIFHDAEK